MNINNIKLRMSLRRNVSRWLGVALLTTLGSVPAFAQPLSGTYSVCPTGCDYASPASAQAAVAANGVSGPVTFNVGAGQYNQTVTFGNVTSMSATNTVTYKGVGSASRVYSTNSGSGVAYVTGRYYRFETMTFENTNSSSGYAVYMTNASYNNFTNCRILAPILTTWNYPYDLYLTNSSYNTFKGNIIQGGYYTVYEYNYNTSYSYGYNTYENNRISQGFYFLFYAYGGYSNTVKANTFDSTGYNYGYTYYSFYEGGLTFEKNIIPTGYNIYSGAFFYYPNYFAANKDYVVVNNIFNMTNTNAYYCMYIYGYLQSNLRLKVYHNTLDMKGTNGYEFYYYSYQASGFDCRNNSFSRQGTGSTAYFYNAATDIIDGNNYYNTGGNLLNYGTNGAAYSDIASYKAAAAANNHGTWCQSSKPTFVNNASDLHLDQTVSAPYAPGISSVPTDIDGDARCVLFATPGADESTFGKAKPTANFFPPSNVYEGTPTVIYNVAKVGEPKIHTWYVDGVMVSDSLQLLTTALKAPSSTVKLVTEGCGGKDSITKTVSVLAPTKAPVSDFIGDKNSLRTGGNVMFTDLSNNGPSNWKWEITPDSTFDNGSKVPTFRILYGGLNDHKLQVRFTQPGKFKVCLTASNSVGTGNTECKVDYIDVIPSINIGSIAKINFASGYLYDDGGPNGGYQYSYNNPKKTIIEACADTIYMQILKFDMYCQYDYLQMWEGGADKSGKALHSCTTNTQYGYGPGFTGGNSWACPGTCIPNPNTIFKAKSSVYLEQITNSGVQDPGFEIFWWSTPKIQAKPVAEFEVTDTVCTNSFVSFTNKSKGDDVTYFWDLDGDLSFFESQSATGATWPYFFAGNYTITLIAQNCGGFDTFTKNIVVADPPTPNVIFSADNLNPTTNDIVFFESNIKECVDNYKWTFTKKYGSATVQYATGSSELSSNPSVILPDTGLWSVQLEVTNITGTGDLIKLDYINVRDAYCNPTAATVLADIGINKVMFADITNTTTSGVRDYSNYVATHSTNVEIGAKIPLTVERNSNFNSISRAVFFDWNADGDFDDIDEMYAVETPGKALIWNDTIEIPAHAKVGASVMRVAANQGNYSNKPCGQNEFGEYEDYRIYITPDITAPVITLNANSAGDKDTIRMQQGDTYVDPGAVAIDNLEGNISNKITVSVAPNFNALIPGTYVFSYNAQDNFANKAVTVKRVVIVENDFTKPTLTVAKPDTLRFRVFTPVTPQAVISALDNVDGDITPSVTITQAVNNAVVGFYEVNYVVSDFFGNTAVERRWIEIYDDFSPILTRVGADTVFVEATTNYTDEGVTYSDNYYSTAELSANLVTENPVNVNAVGTYIVTYNLTDPSGNPAFEVTRVVVVRDTKAPVVEVRGSDSLTIDVLTNFADAGARITDLLDGDITTWDTSGTFYTNFPTGYANKIGTYTIIYTGTDANGNSASDTRFVTVFDPYKPEFDLKGDITINICRWELYTDAGYTVTDKYDPTADIKIDVEGTFVDTDKPGVYSLRYKATDKQGNISYSQNRIIFVREREAPFCSVGLADDQALASAITLYPNPTTGVFQIRTALSNSDRINITVVNAVGQEIAVEASMVGNNTYSMDLSAYPAGVYFVNIKSNNATTTKRVVISK